MRPYRSIYWPDWELEASRLPRPLVPIPRTGDHFTKILPELRRCRLVQKLPVAVGCGAVGGGTLLLQFQLLIKTRGVEGGLGHESLALAMVTLRPRKLIKINAGSSISRPTAYPREGEDMESAQFIKAPPTRWACRSTFTRMAR